MKANNLLREFLADTKKNSMSREKLLTHRVVYDLKLAAAQRGYDLRVFEPDVDRDGYDLILDDGNTIRKLQLKSVYEDSTTSSWEIHKRLFRPPHYLIEKLQLDCSPETEGVGGGFLLIEVHLQDDNTLNLKYFYTDVFVALMMHKGLLTRPKHSPRKKPQQFLDNLFSGPGNEPIRICRSLLAQAKGPEELLALVGMHSRFNAEGLLYNLMKYLNGKEPCQRGHRKFLIEIFSELVYRPNE